MESNNHIGSYTILEERIYDILKQNGASDIKRNEKFTFYGGFYVADYYLPKGCKKLNIEPNTAIEIKYRLLFDSIDRICYRVKKTKIKNLIIIYNEKLRGVSTEIDSKLNNLNVIIKEFSQFEILGHEIDEAANKYKDLPLRELSEQRLNITKTNSQISTIDRLKFSLKNFRSTLILGAGVSISADSADWNTLLKKLIESPKQIPLTDYCFDEIRTYCHDSSLILGRFLMESWRLPDGHFDKDILEIFRNCIYPNNENNSSDLIKEIAKLVERFHPKKNDYACIESIITYNYDDRIEHALTNLKIDCYPVYGNNTPKPKSIPVYHVHGILPFNKNNSYVFPILSEESYHQLYKNTYNWSTVHTLHALMRNTCLLIGLSMSDPNLRRLLEFAASESEGEPRHFVFLKREKFNNIRTQNYVEDRQTKIMEQLGLNVIWINDFKEIPEIIKSI